MKQTGSENLIVLIIAFLHCLIGILFTSCEDNKMLQSDFEKFQFVYLTAARNGKTTISLFSDADVTHYLGGIQYGGTTNFNKGTVLAELTTDISLVDTYNTTNNTDYLALPTNCFSFGNPLLIIENGKHVSNSTSLIIQNVSLMDPAKDYLLPVTATPIDTPEALPFSEDYRTAYIAIVRHETKVVQTERNLILDSGKFKQLDAYVTPETVPDKTLSWSSANPSVATVTQDGIIKAEGVGSTIITAESIFDPAKKVSFNVRVVLKSYDWLFWPDQGLMGMNLTNRGQYWEIETLNNDPYFLGNINGNLNGGSRYFVTFEYQSDHLINDAQFFYFTPDGWDLQGYTNPIYKLDKTEVLDPTNPDKWKVFTMDFTEDYDNMKVWGNNSVLRLDPCNAPGRHILIRKPKIFTE